jgi:hypothetical protein
LYPVETLFCAELQMTLNATTLGTAQELPLVALQILGWLTAQVVLMEQRAPQMINVQEVTVWAVELVCAETV